MYTRQSLILLATFSAVLFFLHPQPPALPTKAHAHTLPYHTVKSPHKKAKAPKDWWRDKVFYQIFPRSFRDSDGDGIGDIKGILQKLDYLKTSKQGKGLGITGLWLTPIFASPSYHGYDVTNYRKLNPLYGNRKIFKALLDNAHKRGIRVVLDLMVNHTSKKHPWFVKSAKSRTSPYREWYVWRDTNPGWTQPWGKWPVWHRAGAQFYYGIFWSGMPDLNLAHPPTKNEMFSIASYWLQQGIDGYRLDAARHLFANGPGEGQNDQPQTHTFWQAFHKNMKKTAPKSLMLGEVWAPTKALKTYCRKDEFDLLFHFPLAKAIQMAVSAMEAKPIWKVIKASIPTHCWATFLSNHDQVRWATRLMGQTKMLRMGAWLLMTLPGTPFIYYGEELGMTNGPQKGDPGKRTPMPWDASAKGGFTTGTPWTQLAPHKQANVATQQKDPSSLQQLYRKLIHWRHRLIALRRGTLKRITLAKDVKGRDAVVAFSRVYKKGTHQQTVWMLLNLNDEATGTFKLTLPTTRRVKRLLKEGNTVYNVRSEPQKNRNALTLRLGAQSGVLLQLF